MSTEVRRLRGSSDHVGPSPAILIRAFLEYVQQRLRDAAVFTLPFALIGVGVAVWWNPGARAEDIALVVGIPIGLVALSGKVLSMRNPRLTPRSK
jgi:hypothetical protein